MGKEVYGFGIIGAGMIARFHARAIAEIENATLKGIYSRTSSKVDDFAKEHQCQPFYSLEEMLQNKEIQVVCICTPSGQHLGPALKAIHAGKHCLIEKPLEITTERCDQIIEAAQKANIKAGVIFPSRFYKAEKQLHQAVKEKRFGNPVMGDAYVKWYRKPEYYQSGQWRGTWQFDGGGALMNQGIHSVDLLQWYMGPVLSVQAVSTNAFHKEIEVEDTIVASLQFQNGALGVIECSTATFPGSLKRIEIRGTDGSAVLEEDQLIEWVFRHSTEEDQAIKKSMHEGHLSSGGASDPSAISFLGHQLQIEDMIRAIEKGTDPLVTAIEGKKSVTIIEAIYESAKTGNKVIIT